MAIEEGKAAPAFTLTDAEGTKVSLKDFAGKNVILYFYPKDDTPSTTAFAFCNAFQSSRKPHASFVHPGVSSFGSVSYTHLTLPTILLV